MSEKFSPGPWRVEQDTVLVWGACDAHDESSWGMGYPVATAHVMLGSGSPLSREARHDEADANAYLIAAAPELYEALKEAMRLVDVDIIRVRPSEKTDLMNWLTQCGAALAKARGEA